jgi:hypothetical protein
VKSANSSEKWIQHAVGRLLEKNPIERGRLTWIDNIETDLREAGFEISDRVQLAQDMIERQVYESHRVIYKWGISWEGEQLGISCKVKVKLSLCLVHQTTRHEDVRRSGRVAPPFSTSALDECELSGLRSCRFTPGKEPTGTHWIGGWVGPRERLDAVEWRKISCLCRKWNPGRPARSSSLYRLSYPGFCTIENSYWRHKWKENYAQCKIAGLSEVPLSHVGYKVSEQWKMQR